MEEVTGLLKARLENQNSILYQIFDIQEIYQLLERPEDDLLPWFGQLMTKPQLIAYLYQFDLWVEEYHIQVKI